jgi:hypothetical protein
MHYLAQKIRQGQASMGQSLHLVRVVAQKAKHTYENKVSIFIYVS